MSITTYAELQTALTSWLGSRTDLTSYYADWIARFEDHAARKLRVRPMETVGFITTSGGAGALPTDYLGFKEVISTDGPLEYASDEYLNALFPTYPTGTATFFSIVGSVLYVYPQQDATFTFIYYAKNTAVSSALNWLFTNHPDAYLNGALLEAAIFTSDTDAAVVFKARRDEIMNEISLLNFKERAGMAVKVMGNTP